MAKRVYKDKVLPIENQIEIAQCNVRQNTDALAEAESDLAYLRRHGASWGNGSYIGPRTEAEALRTIEQRRAWLDASLAKLADLRAQAAA